MEKMENQKMHTEGKVCNCPHHKVLPILTVLTGVDFLLGSLRVFTYGFVDITWPILLIIAGFIWMNGNSCRCC
jgi:hypothetical protein